MQPNVQMHLNEDRDVINHHITEFKETSGIKHGIIANIGGKLNGQAVALIKDVQKFIGKDVIVNFLNSDLVEFISPDMYVSLEFNGSSINIFELNNINFDINVYGDYKRVESVYKKLRSKYKSDGPSVAWYFRDSDGDLQYSNFDLSTEKTVYPEFYPFIKDADTIGTRFLNSDTNVLILLGPPGTGKTSFIRNILLKLNQGAITTYDDDIMNMDKFYIRYLNSNYNFIVLEDADLLLQTRDKDDNRVMSKILNTSDGLISTKDKKFIFTANITQESRIDDALMRPGRCFDVLHFRELQFEEAQLASNAAGLGDLEDEKDYTLAEIFNRKKTVHKKSRLGFL